MTGLKVIVTGATGMVGQGVLRECLLDADVEKVLAIGRSPSGKQDAKLREIVLRDFSEFETLEAEVGGYDACFFCLGVSSVGIKEADYRRVTKELTLGVARTLVKANPQMIFIYVTGVGTDSTEKGRSMWARVKGETENELLRMGFRGAYMFRPGYIQPAGGVRSKYGWANAIYAAIATVYPLLKRIFPGQVVTTAEVGKAMIRVAEKGYEKKVLEPRDIGEAASG